MKSENIGHKNLINLPTSPVVCCHFTLENLKSLFSTTLQIRTSDYLPNVRIKRTVAVTEQLNCLLTVAYCFRLYMLAFENYSIIYGQFLQANKRDISANRLLRRHSTFSKFVMVSVAVSTNVILPSLEQKSTVSTIKTCCWYRSCYQRSAALLETCLSSSKTMH